MKQNKMSKINVCLYCCGLQILDETEIKYTSFPLENFCFEF